VDRFAQEPACSFFVARVQPNFLSLDLQFFAALAKLETLRGSWQSNRKAVGELLQSLRERGKRRSFPITSFTNGVSILTPLIGSLVAILLGGNK